MIEYLIVLWITSQIEQERYSDYLKLMSRTRNENYGRAKCFDCLLGPKGDDPVSIGINRPVLKGLLIYSPKIIIKSTEILAYWRI